MKASRMTAQKQWQNIGRNAAAKGIPLKRVLTKDESVNQLIRKGYEGR